MNAIPPLSGRTALVTGSTSGLGAGIAEALTAAVVFLAGPHAANIHGTILTVDGGLTAV